MNPGSLIQTPYPNTLRMHRRDPYGHEYSSPKMRYMNAFLFHPHEVGLLLEESRVSLEDISDEYADLVVWKILTPSGIGYISTGWGNIPRYLKVIA
jgi:hypothetical protein